MRNFLVFDLGETLIDFNLEGEWYKNLKEEVIPLMYKNLTNSQELYSSDLKKLEQFHEIAYNSIAIPHYHVSMLKRIQEYFKILKIPLKKSLIETQIDAFNKILKQKTTLYEDVEDILSDLHSSKYEIALWSNTPWQCPGYIIEQLMTDYDIRKYFDYVFFSGDYEIQKPDPKYMEIVIKGAKQQKKNMIYIGNSEVDIITGYNFGIPIIWINRNNQKLSKDCPKPKFTINSLEEISSILPFS